MRKFIFALLLAIVPTMAYGQASPCPTEPAPVFVRVNDSSWTVERDYATRAGACIGIATYMRNAANALRFEVDWMPCPLSTAWRKGAQFTSMSAALTAARRPPVCAAPPPPPPVVDSTVSLTVSGMAFLRPVDSLRVNDTISVGVTVKTAAGLVLGNRTVIVRMLASDGTTQTLPAMFNAAIGSYVAVVSSPVATTLTLQATVDGALLPSQVTLKVFVPVVAPPPVVVPDTGKIFLESFSGQPAAPLTFASSSRWDVNRYSRNPETWFTPIPMNALHGMDCGAPPATHSMASFDGMAFICRDHVMTAAHSGEGYAVVVLTPNRMLDFTQKAETLSFNLSTHRSSKRDWVNIHVSAWDTHLSTPAGMDAPGLNNPATNSVYVEQTNEGNLCPRYVRDGVTTVLPCNNWPDLESRITPSMTVRSPVVIVISRTHIKVTWNGVLMADADFPAPLSFTQGVVQLGHYSYNPEKDCSFMSVNGGCQANTWHWDEVRLSNSVPFTMIPSDLRATGTNNAVFTLAAPAPANARLRFFAHSRAPQVSFNDGATWVNSVAQAMSRTNDPEAQFWMPIPAGTVRVRVRGGAAIAWGDANGPWLVRDLSVWSK